MEKKSSRQDLVMEGLSLSVIATLGGTISKTLADYTYLWTLAISVPVVLTILVCQWRVYSKIK